jgi:drug/metabolite transporter (DMT)-like permease
MGRMTFLWFVGLTMLCWGLYGPVLHEGQERLGDGLEKSTLRAFICVGIAYFLIAVVFPIAVLFRSGEKGSWSLSGFIWSFGAGAIGAVGALGIVMAFKFGGTPVFVMPLVFGCAPVMNTLFTMLLNRTTGKASALFYISIAIVAVGAIGVLTFKPKKVSPKKETTVQQPTNQTEEAEQPDDAEPLENAQVDEKEVGKSSSELVEKKLNKPNDDAPAKGPNFTNLMFVLLTALCWGAYGPVLHAGQAKMKGSRLRPFLCVGLAYFVIAVIAPYFLLVQFPEPGSWSNWGGVIWALLGGTAGALGALGIIYAFNFGGKPIYVMPLVFGGAPIVNTISETLAQGLWNELSTPFFISLAVVIFGACMVLISAPKSPPPTPAPSQSPEPAAS